jgi:ribosome-associated translation inhibitor RaiA
MQIHWAQFPDAMTEQRSAAEQRLQRLAQEDRHLGVVRIVARPLRHHRQGGQAVKLTGHVRGREIVVCEEGQGLGRALADAVESFERQIHRLRERRRAARTAH